MRLVEQVELKAGFGGHAAILGVMGQVTRPEVVSKSRD